MPKPGGDPSSGTSPGDVLIRPERHPACRRREAQPGSRKKLTCSGHATNSWRRAASLTSFHSLRVGNAGGRLVRNVRTWPAIGKIPHRSLILANGEPRKGWGRGSQPSVSRMDRNQEYCRSVWQVV